MSRTEPEVASESVLGWARLGIGTLAALILPVWALVSAAIGQLFPVIRGVVVEDNGTLVEVTYPIAIQVFLAGASGAGVLLVVVLLIAAVLAAWTAISGGQLLRGRAERERLDAMVADAAVLPDDAWDHAAPVRELPEEDAEPQQP